MEEYIKIGKLDIKKLGKYKKTIKTDEVILTLERIEHIKEKHKGQFEKIHKYIKKVIEDPDYILHEMKHEDTIILLKEVIKNETKIKIIIKLATNNIENRKNSIITFWQIRNRDYKKTIEKSKIIYKKLDKEE